MPSFKELSGRSLSNLEATFSAPQRPANPTRPSSLCAPKKRLGSNEIKSSRATKQRTCLIVPMWAAWFSLTCGQRSPCSFLRWKSRILTRGRTVSRILGPNFWVHQMWPTLTWCVCHTSSSCSPEWNRMRGTKQKCAGEESDGLTHHSLLLCTSCFALLQEPGAGELALRVTMGKLLSLSP